MKSHIVDERLSKIFPEEEVHSWEIQESKAYHALELDLGDNSKAKVDELLDVMQEIERKLVDKCLAEANKNSWREFFDGMNISRYA